ncbi:MAG: efflux RND transporter permease subunit, partial [Actinomycetota bacterium]
MEQIALRLAERRTGGDDRAATARVVLEASVQVRAPIAYALAIILLAVLPFVVLKGIAGALVPPLAFSFAVSLLAAMAVALTVTPALALLILPRVKERTGSSPSKKLAGGYERSLARMLPTAAPAVLAIVLVVAGLAAVPFLKRSVLPSFKEGDFLVEVDAAPGTSLPEMDRVSALIAAELRTIPGVRNVGAQVGRAVLGDRVVGVDSAQLWISIDPDADHDATMTSVRGVIGGYPGLDMDVLTHSAERLTEVLTGVDAPIQVRVFGPDLEVLRAQAEQLRKTLAGIEGIVDPTAELDVTEPALEVQVNLAAAQRYGIKPGDVRRAAAALLSGIEVGSLFEEQKIFEVVVWGVPELRHSLSSVRDLQIDKPGGGTVRLGDVASVELRPNPTVVVRESVSRSIDVIAGVRGRSVGAVTKDVEQRLERIGLPLEDHAELLGDQAEQRAARSRLIGAAIAAAIAILLLLQV